LLPQCWPRFRERAADGTGLRRAFGREDEPGRGVVQNRDRWVWRVWIFWASRVRRKSCAGSSARKGEGSYAVVAPYKVCERAADGSGLRRAFGREDEPGRGAAQNRERWVWRVWIFWASRVRRKSCAGSSARKGEGSCAVVAPYKVRERAKERHRRLLARVMPT